MRKQLFKIHSYLGLFSLLPFLVICLTGSLLVFKQEIDVWLMPEKASIIDASGSRQDMDTLLAVINQTLPDYELGSWELFDDHHEADRIFVIKRGTDKWYKAHLDPYAGKVLSQPVETTHYITDWLLSLHYTLLLNDIDGLNEHLGLLFTSLFAIFLTLLGISGLIIYRKFWQRFLTLRWDKKMMVFFSDLHKMVGVTASPVLLILGITGGYFNISMFVMEELEHAEGAEHHIMQQRLYNDNLSLQALLEDSSKRLEGFRATYLLMPYEPGLPFTFFGRVPTNPLLSNYASTVSYDAQQGSHTVSYDIREQGLGTQTIDSFRRLHFGNFGGLLIKTLWCLMGLMPIVLGGTGFYLWFHRHSKRKSARRNRRKQIYQTQNCIQKLS
ncbi:PepSY-associated TM helix domain-containing protein [Aliiglaciecola sp. LCG003]|uniref:PepSY-associated TM helix domain-containing protein n=1 Tax=Aliiglaciecola sp. LCG003 TaxID=3053655 RepID=UPI002572EB4F|nr:PepSY-associated TM helix domain-containing protein [Aliiglaciecola sp. LCG003]WJG10119.1 PepSY-associated TM helix domain-containing protein [Aliiglaciecola sp. LCG003]